MMLDRLLKTLRLSLQRPKQGMRVVLGWQLSLQESALALLLTAVVSATLISLVIGPMPPEMDKVTAELLASPFSLAFVQAVGLAMMALCLHLMGRMAGGRGTLPQAVMVMAWLEVILILISVLQTVTLLVLPPLGLLLVVGGMILSLWLIANFVAELHGFDSLFLTLLGVAAAFVAAIFAMIFLMFMAFLLGVLHV